MPTTYLLDNNVYEVPVAVVLIVVGHSGGKSRVIARQGLLPAVWLQRHDNPTVRAAELFRRLTGVTAKTEPAGTGWVPVFCAGATLVDGFSGVVFTAAFDPGSSNPIVPDYQWTEISDLYAEAALLLRTYAGRI